ncbi:DUF6301 family protein [Pseudactinotalea sp.]|uniref:DUF6301 family protein n=1 Tax=Pseudactinotalea sp. TaxID=1926260 RepID=UPI003B3ACE1A
MTATAQASSDDVARYAAAFAGATWPLTRSRLRRIAEELGWTLRSDRPKGMMFRSGLPLGFDRVSCLVADDDVDQVTIDLTDEATAATSARIARELTAAVETELGAPTGVRNAPRSSHWDLPGDGRIAIQNLGPVVVLDILSPRYSGIERAEERYGLDTDEVPDDV